MPRRDPVSGASLSAMRLAMTAMFLTGLADGDTLSELPNWSFRISLASIAPFPIARWHPSTQPPIVHEKVDRLLRLALDHDGVVPSELEPGSPPSSKVAVTEPLHRRILPQTVHLEPANTGTPPMGPVASITAFSSSSALAPGGTSSQ